jgi:methyltransferase (TIGR00027 family)
MRRKRPSLTAQYVAVVRHLLTRMEVVDDPLAASMLRPPMKALAQALRHPPLDRHTRSPLFAGLGARTLFFDEKVSRALDAGLDQVVVVGAGYDSRAWRLGRPGVRFFELDHPATQGDKRRRAPAGGPAYVACDLSVDKLAPPLLAAGFDRDRPAMFTVEGVTMYLAEAHVRSLLAQLADLGSPTSRLAVNFAAPAHAGATRDRRRQRVLGLLGRAGSEPFRFSIHVVNAGEFVESCGWQVTEVLAGPELGRRFLQATRLPIDSMNPAASAASAIRG